jgi:hypothetical protein
VVADGQAFKLPQVAPTIFNIAPKLVNFTNWKGIQRGDLAAALDYAEQEMTPFSEVREADLINITNLALTKGIDVTPKLLKLSENEAADFLIRYEAEHRNYELVRDPTHNIIRASSSTELSRLDSIARAFSNNRRYYAEELYTLLAQKLGYQIGAVTEYDNTLVRGIIQLQDMQLSQLRNLPIFVSYGSQYTDQATLFNTIDGNLLTLGQRVGVLIELEFPDEARRFARQYSASHPAQITVLALEELRELLLNSRESAREFLMRNILKNIDLTLVSPFVVRGPTTREMFFGRESEIRQIIEQSKEQSFALIGGRCMSSKEVGHERRLAKRDFAPV